MVPFAGKLFCQRRRIFFKREKVFFQQNMNSETKMVSVSTFSAFSAA